MSRREIEAYVNEYYLDEFGEVYIDNGERMIGIAYTEFERVGGGIDEVQVWYDTERLELVTEVNGKEVERIAYAPEDIVYIDFDTVVSDWEVH